MYTTKDGKYEVDLLLYRQREFMGKEVPGIALQVYRDEEPYCTLTKSFGEFIGLKNCAYIDTNNIPNAESFMDGFGRETGFTKQSGYCSYPLYEFDEGFLRNCNNDDYEKYSDEYEKYMMQFEEPDLDDKIEDDIEMKR